MIAFRDMWPRPADPSPAYPYRWRVKACLPARFGQRCRVVVRSRTMNSALVEFPDGLRVVTSRNYLRKVGDAHH